MKFYDLSLILVISGAVVLTVIAGFSWWKLGQNSSITQLAEKAAAEVDDEVVQDVTGTNPHLENYIPKEQTISIPPPTSKPAK